MRHDLVTEGAWVELRDVEDLRAKDRKKVTAIVMSAVSVDLDGEVTTGPEMVSLIMEAAPDAVIGLLVAAWEIPYLPDAQLPCLDVDALGELKLDDYDRLKELVAPAQALLMPHSSNNVDDHADPRSPSEPVSA